MSRNKRVDSASLVRYNRRMPELPEVETVARELAAVLPGKEIAAVHVFWPKCIEGSRKGFQSQLPGKKIVAVCRRGKFLCISLAGGGTITIHLRMTGKLLFRVNAAQKKHLRLVMQFQDGTALHFLDTRKFGRLRCWPADEPLLVDLGAEPLVPEVVRSVLDRLCTSRVIKTVLLDQKVLAGIGNIYADEALFAAGIHPRTPASQLRPRQRGKLSRSVPQVLHAAIVNGGTTISDYRTTTNAPGRHQRQLQVYGREGQSCPKCGALIEKIRLQGRGTHFCPRCQMMK